MGAARGADPPAGEGGGKRDSHAGQLVHSCHRHWVLPGLCSEGKAVVAWWTFSVLTLCQISPCFKKINN